MNPPPLVDESGRPLPLDRRLASGGEGAVFTLAADSARVVKVYHRPPTPQTVDKLRAMVRQANPRLLAVAAWPQALALDAKARGVAGFVMPRLVDCQPVQALYNPVQRLKNFPRAGWSFQVRAALNLAAAFDEVHKAGCVVGDVNQSNAQVTPQALARLIDCDSFQVRASGAVYPCEVGVPHYTPPELQGKSFRGVARTENHDRFGLAVLVYQLLFAGRHPYAGVYTGPGDPSFEQLITEFRFAQGPRANTWGMAPPPHTPTLADVPPAVSTLFRRAFERGSDQPDARPRPDEWAAALKQLEAETATCSADPGHTHWRGAGRCVWCRLAERGGPEYYFGVSGTAGTFAVDEAKLRDVAARLAAADLGAARYDRRRFAPAEPPDPEPVPPDLADHRNSTAVVAGAAALCVLAVPFGLVRGYVCAIGLLGAMVFGAWAAVLLSRSPWRRELRRRRVARDLARADLEDLEAEWDRATRRHGREHADLSASARGLAAAVRGLAADYQAELGKLAATAEAAARTRHLRLHLIADADIPKVGAGRKQTLASHSIFTAADVDPGVIQGIRGFGPALTGSLAAWKADVLRQFRFDPATGVSPADQKAVGDRFRGRQRQLFADLDRKLGGLEPLGPALRAATQKLVPELRRAVADYEQADADLRELTRRR